MIVEWLFCCGLHAELSAGAPGARKALAPPGGCKSLEFALIWVGTGRGVRCHAGVNADRASSLCPVLSIGVIREGPLHGAVTAVLAQAGDRLEVPVGRFVIDLVRADGELVEVYTGGFAALGTRLAALLTSTSFALGARGSG